MYALPFKEERTIITKDNARSKISLFYSETVENPLVICMPAMGVPADYYTGFAKNLCRKGLNVITADLRGNGHSTIRASRDTTFGFHEMISYDWPAIINEARKLFPASPLFLLGHSLGGQLNSLYISRNPENLAGLILVASGSVHYKGWPFPQNLKILLGTQITRMAAGLFGYLPGKQLGFGGREARTVIRDWAHTALTGHYEPANTSYDYESSLKKTDIPILAISFKRDHFAPDQSAKNLYGKMNPSHVKHFCLTRNDIKAPGFIHFAWVRHSDPIVSKIKTWVYSLQKN